MIVTASSLVLATLAGFGFSATPEVQNNGEWYKLAMPTKSGEVYTVGAGQRALYGIEETFDNDQKADVTATVKFEALTSGELAAKIAGFGKDIPHGAIALGDDGKWYGLATNETCGWVALSGVAGEAGVEKSAKMKFEFIGGKRMVCYIIDGRMLADDNGASWFATTVSDTLSRIEFVGCSEFASGKGELAAENANELSAYESYALGLDPADESSRPLTNKRQASAAGKLALGLDNVKVNPASVVKPKFTLKESTDNSSFESVGSAQPEPEFEVELSSDKVKYYKIEYSFD